MVRFKMGQDFSDQFADPPANPVAPDRVPESPGYHDADPDAGGFLDFEEVDMKETTGQTLSFPADFLKLPTAFERQMTGEARPRRPRLVFQSSPGVTREMQLGTLGQETFAPLLTPPGQNAPSRFGFHSRPESVLPLSRPF